MALTTRAMLRTPTDDHYERCSEPQTAKPTNARRSRRVATAAAADKQESRRAALVAFTAAASMAAKSALAITIPSQASSGGLGRESGIAFSSTQASSSGYTLEGTKKTGMSVKTKRGTLASVRAAAEAEVNAPKAAAAKPAKGKK